MNSTSQSQLAAMVTEATVDSHDESERVVGLFTMLEEHLAVPFQTTVLGVKVTVESIDLTDDDRIVATCTRDRTSQGIALQDLPLPTPPPAGVEWVEAYRYWLG